MAISEAAEQRMIAARAARNKQDKKHPFVINIHDGRLLPNVPNLRAHSNYRVYTGDPKASAQERLRFLSVAGHRPRVVDSEVSGEQPPPPPFDIAKAGRDELVEFAASQYGAALDPGAHLNALRAQVRALARDANDLSDLT